MKASDSKLSNFVSFNIDIEHELSKGNGQVNQKIPFELVLV